jgi:hypothetical protein
MRYSPLPVLLSRLLHAASFSGAMMLTIPIIASAAPSTPLLATHLVRAESIQKSGYYWHHRYQHHRRWHHRYSHYGRSGWHYG